MVIEAVGRPEAWEWAIDMVRKGGTVNFFGGCAKGTRVQLNTERLHYSEITLKATFHHTPDTVRRAFALIAERKIKGADYITGEAPLSQAAIRCCGRWWRAAARSKPRSFLDTDQGKTIDGIRAQHSFERRRFYPARIKIPATLKNLLARGWASLPPEYAIPAVAPSLDEARGYCRRLATSHYENFSVATWFLPKHLHQHFFNVYAYCRISDDLGDEVGDTALSLALLDRWEQELDATYLSWGSRAGRCAQGR